MRKLTAFDKFMDVFGTILFTAPGIAAILWFGYLFVLAYLNVI